MKKLLLLALFAVAACRTPQEVGPAPSDKPAEAKAGDAVRITLVGTNDVHGWVAGQTDKLPNGDIKSGGAATFAGYVKAMRAENPDGVVLVDGGDLFQGTLMSNITEGAVVIDAFNLVGYDAAAIGNHEFDYGPLGPVSAAQEGMDPFGALKARIAQARFPLLSANIYDAATGIRPSWMRGDGMVIIERKGLKIGIVGLTTPTTPQVTLPINVASLRFGSLAPEALTASRLLRQRGADLVIAVVHAGGKCGDCSNAHDTTTCDLDSGEIFEMMRGLPKGTLDAVVAGHTHAQIGHFIEGTPIMENFALGRAFGVIELYVDPQTRKPDPRRTEIHAAIPICLTVDEKTKSCDGRSLRAMDGGKDVHPVAVRYRGQIIEQDAMVAQALMPADAKVASLQTKPLGLKVRATLGRNYEAESPLGSFLTDSMRLLTRADVALFNPGGLRADLQKGELTYGNVYEVMPFDNQAATIELSGEQLTRLLNAAYGAKKGVFQVSGLRITLSRCKTADRVKTVTLPNRKPIDPAGRYKVVMPDFLARGGDGLAPFLATVEPKYVDYGDARGNNLRDELVAFWQLRGETFDAPPSGRVTFLDDARTCPDSLAVDPSASVP